MIPGGLYGVVDPAFGDPRAQLGLLLDEGVKVVQLRCKGWTTEAVVQLGLEAPSSTLLVVNDDVAAARALGAWVHLGQDDGPDPELPFGRSTHSEAQAQNAGRACYLGYGPIFATSTKATGYAPRGCAALAAAVPTTTLPIVAIGGIGPSNLDEVRRTGVRAWASIGAIWTAPDPRAVIRAMR